MNKEIIKYALKSKKRLKKFNPPPFPRNIERDYQKDLLKIVEDIYTQIKNEVIALLPGVAQSIGQTQLKTDGVDDITKAIKNVKKNIYRKYTDEELASIALKKGMSIAEFNNQATKRDFKRVLGVDLFTTNAPMVQAVSIFTTQNVSLSKSLIEESIGKVESKILQGFSSGTRWEEISKDIEKFIDPSIGNIAGRAKLIARDQVSKLNGQVTQERQKSLGVDKYIWRTSLDERVRDTHLILEGRTFSWDDPPDVGHPGEDFQCRCTAEPVLDKFFE